MSTGDPSGKSHGQPLNCHAGPCTKTATTRSLLAEKRKGKRGNWVVQVFSVTTSIRWVAATAHERSLEELPHTQGRRNPSKTAGSERGNQRTERLKLQSQTTSQANHMNHSLIYLMKLSHAVWGRPRLTGHGGEVWQNVVHRRRERQTTSVFLPWEPHEEYEKAKR